MEHSVIIAGMGGQGVLMSGKLLAEAAMIEDKHVTWFPSYGAEMRGGTANCTVVISGTPIGSPVVTETDVLVVLNRESLLAFEDKLRPGGILLLDSTNIKRLPERDDTETLDMPASVLASDAGVPRSVNIVLMGALIERTGLVSAGSAIEAIGRLGISEPEANEKAFNSGREAVADKKG